MCKVRKNSEQRKAKSRDAARNRRSTESEIFSEISELLPISKDVSEQRDKISIIRLAASYLKTLHVMEDFHADDDCNAHINPVEYPARVMSSFSGSNENKQKMISDKEMMESFEGFMMILNKDGTIIYSSESVDRYLGLNHLDLMGNSLYEYTHPCDHQEMDHVFNAAAAINNHPQVTSFGPMMTSTTPDTAIRDIMDQPELKMLIRVKSTITGRGKSVNLKQASYKVCVVSIVPSTHAFRSNHHHRDPLKTAERIVIFLDSPFYS